MIAFTEIKDQWEIDFLKKLLPGRELLFLEGPAQDHARELAKTRVLSVFVNSRVGRDFMDRLPELKMIATRSTGFDHIDLQAAKEKGIAVCNVPVYGENTVAEHTLALILSLSRKLREAYLRTVRNDFSLDGLMGFDLMGKTLGVIGTGHIGLHVIRMALGFGMKVVAFDPKPKAAPDGFEYASFEEVLKRSDILTLHAPYLPATRHLINKKNIGLIKKGCFLINTSRGGLIETGALIEALDQKILAGAGLDVLEDEEYVLEEKRLIGGPETKEHWQKIQTTLKNHVLLQRENVIYTPHMAFYSIEAVQRILETAAENICAFLDGRHKNLAGGS